ncbi:putative cAMP-dependent protein kinase inhibitor [Cooperia oncophora]
MGELEAESDTLEHFVASGRAGRRDALPQIDLEINDPGAAKLAERLSDLSARCDDHEESHHRDDPNGAGPSNNGS